MVEAIGAKVVELTRTRIGTIRIGTLQAGKLRSLTAAEVDPLKK